MSELKAFRIIQGDTGGYGAPSYKCDTDGNRIEEWPDACEVYDRYEVDNVIAAKNKEIAELKSDIADLCDDKKSTDAILDERNAEITKLQAIIEKRDKTIEELIEGYSSLESEAAALKRRVYAANRDARRTRY